MLKPKRFLKSPSVDIQTITSVDVLLWKHRNEACNVKNIIQLWLHFLPFVIRQVKSLVPHLHVQQTWD